MRRNAIAMAQLSVAKKRHVAVALRPAAAAAARAKKKAAF